MIKPQETKQRRLSTLNNLSSRDIFKKVSTQSTFSNDSSGTTSTVEKKTHVIGIPKPPTPSLPVKRRRSTVSRRGSTVKRKSVSETPSASTIPSAASSVPPQNTVVESENEGSNDGKINAPKITTLIIPVEKNKEPEPLSPKDSSSQDPFTSSIPIPSTQPSSVPSTAPERSQQTATTIITPASQVSKPTTTMTQSATVSREESPLPIGIPITRPNTAPSLSTKAQAKAPEDPVSSSPDSTTNNKSSNTNKDEEGEEIEGLVYNKTLNQLKRITYRNVNELKEDEQLIESFKASKYLQLSKNFNNLKPELLENVEIDEEHFKIEDLCKPTLPIGRVSANFQQAQEARKNKMAQRKHRKALRLLAKEKKIPYEILLNESSKNVKNENDGSDAESEASAPSAPPITSTSTSGLQLKISDGKLIVDEESRVLDRHANFESDDRERHNQNPFENVVNSATYGKQRYTDKWGNDEVLQFYKALGQWGTDFGLIAQMFPHRTRRQVKAKFILEEKKRPRLVDLALNNKLNGNFDFEQYCSDSNKTFGTLNDFNAKLEQLKKEHEENLKELSVAREKAREEDAIRQKKKELEVKAGGGNRQMTRQERLIELRKHETVLGSIDEVKKQREAEEAEAAAAAAAEVADTA